jgi:hypothetical protein
VSRSRFSLVFGAATVSITKHGHGHGLARPGGWWHYALMTRVLEQSIVRALLTSWVCVMRRESAACLSQFEARICSRPCHASRRQSAANFATLSESKDVDVGYWEDRLVWHPTATLMKKQRYHNTYPCPGLGFPLESMFVDMIISILDSRGTLI